MAADQKTWGIRLADARIPSWWGGGVLVLALAFLVRSIRGRRAWKEAEGSLSEAGDLFAQRLRAGDDRDARMTELTERMTELTSRMEKYGKVTMRLSQISLLVAVAALVVAVVAVLAGA